MYDLVKIKIPGYNYHCSTTLQLIWYFLRERVSFVIFNTRNAIYNFDPHYSRTLTLNISLPQNQAKPMRSTRLIASQAIIIPLAFVYIQYTTQERPHDRSQQCPVVLWNARAWPPLRSFVCPPFNRHPPRSNGRTPRAHHSQMKCYSVQPQSERTGTLLVHATGRRKTIADAADAKPRRYVELTRTPHAIMQ